MAETGWCDLFITENLLHLFCSFRRLLLLQLKLLKSLQPNLELGKAGLSLFCQVLALPQIALMTGFAQLQTLLLVSPEAYFNFVKQS